MDRSSDTWGLVVGIDEYDEPAVRRLSGAAADAVAAVKWLRRLGVPDAQILLHAAPCATTEPEIAALGLPPRDARWSSLEASLYGTLRKAASGKRLFVFLSGHGVFEPATSHRMFLPQDYGANGLWRAIDLESLIVLLLSTPFEQQFLFMDGCQNYPYSQNQRPTIDPGLLSLTNITAAPNNRLVTCYSAAQGQFALEIAGRGAMMRPLLELLDCDRLRHLKANDPVEQAVQYDWQSGERRLDLHKLFYECIQKNVEETARRQTPPQDQTPVAEPRGKAGADPSWLMLRLPGQPTAKLRIEVDPAQAVSDVEEIYIQTQRPRRAHSLPARPATAITVPADFVVPQTDRVSVECRLREDAAWVVQPDQLIRIKPPATASFKLRPSHPAAVPDPLDAFNIRLLRPDGQIDYVFPQIYPDVLGSIGLPDGIRFEHHEHGPDIFADAAGPGATRDFARGFAAAVRRHPAAREHELVLAPPGRSVQRSRANLRFEWQSDPRRLAGFLAERKLVFIDRADGPEQPPPWRDESGAEGDYSLRELFELDRIRARPGLARVRIDLPWGRWTHPVEITASEPAAVVLPSSIGDPPLRVDMSADEPGSLLVRQGSGWSHLYRAGASDIGHWSRSEGDSLLELNGGQTASFAQHRDRKLIVDFRGRAPRAEPFSATDAVEWDLLVGKGRLDALSGDRLRGLCRSWAHGNASPSDDELFGIVLGYAAYSARLNAELGAVLRRVARLGGEDILDRQLLSLRGEDGSRRKPAGSLIARLESGEVPLFRWGVSLARDACGDKIPILRETADRLSLTSTWTCWTADAAGWRS